MPDVVLTTSDASRWRDLLPADRSVFGSVEFAKNHEAHTGFPARLFSSSSGDTSVLYPFFLRPVGRLPFAAEDAAGWWDAATPEYTGPLVTGASATEALAEFAERFSAYCAGEGIISEFAHLHPWHIPVGAIADATLDRQIVYVDLTLDEDELWRQSLNRTCRKHVTRAVGEGVEIRAAGEEEDVREVARVYALTMDRVRAQSRYRFPVEYFLTLRETLPGNSRFLLAEHAGEVIAATLLLHDETDVYAYLGGDDGIHRHLRPANLLNYEAMRWGRSEGKRRLVLGGGYRPGDGVMRFKESFSPLRADHRVVRRVHLPAAYSVLLEQWSAFYGEDIEEHGYFPRYRVIPDDAPRSPG
jgi:hypothetical protein